MEIFKHIPSNILQKNGNDYAMKKMKKKRKNEQYFTSEEFLKIKDEIKYNFESRSSGENEY